MFYGGTRENTEIGSLAGADPGFPVGGGNPRWGCRRPMKVLFGKNLCQNGRIRSGLGGWHVSEIFMCRSATVWIGKEMAILEGIVHFLLKFYGTMMRTWFGISSTLARRYGAKLKIWKEPNGIGSNPRQ